MPFYVRTISLTGPADEVDAVLPRHREHLRELKARGRLRVAGILRRGDGLLEIFEATDLLDAEEIARSSPLVSEGLCAWTVREWEEIDP
jgi:uncharacterized protein YciI